MAKNVIMFTMIDNAPDPMGYAEYSLKTWKAWAKKNDVQVIELTEPLYPIDYMKVTWQRWYVHQILDANGIEYDNVALVDTDTMVHWDCPNFFEETGGDFGVVMDNDNINWVLASIEGYQHMFEHKLDWEEYFNCGFIVMNKNHKDFAGRVTDFYHINQHHLIELQHKTLHKGSDQTPVNYMARDPLFPISVKMLPKKFNLTHLNRKELLHNGKFVDAGWVWHFNGFDKVARESIMKQTWEFVQNNYL